MARSGRKGWPLRLAISLLLPILAGALGGWATSQGVTGWYVTLEKPPFNPPSWVFGPVWTLLYLLMGLALFLVWDEGGELEGRRLAMVWFAIQLALNTLWSVLFFGVQSPGWALLELIALWGAIALTVTLFFRIRALAGWLLVPYLGWVTYAGVLNASIWYLNR